MNRKFLGVAIGFIILYLTGCGDCGRSNSITPSTQSNVTQIISNPALDGAIVQNSPVGFTVTQGNTQSVAAGIDPSTGAEHRAFLNFPLTGGGGVPGTAVIISATLDFVINSILPQPLPGSIPIRIDLISDLSPPLVQTDFDRSLRPALATITITPEVSQADYGGHVTVDVTSLATEARRLGLANFQVRILEDTGAVSPGLIEINDTTGVNRELLAPVLRVTY